MWEKGNSTSEFARMSALTKGRRAIAAVALLLAVIAAGVSVFIAATGGFVWRWGPLRISAREITNPTVVAVLGAVAAWLLSTRDERRGFAVTVVDVVRDPRRLRLSQQARRYTAPLTASTAALAVVMFGLLKGSFVAGGADAYGYVSQADLWISRRLIVRQPFAREMTWPYAAETLAPLGYRPYRPAARGTDIVPICSPGLPMLMAVFKMLAGPRGVFFVVPLLAGLAVWATYVMGRRLAGPLVGASAAVLLAASPSFLIETTAPGSDVPVTAWWACAFALLTLEGRAAVLGAGIATAMAILTRPNLAPLGAVPCAFLVWRTWREPSAPALQRLILFAAGSLPGLIAVAAINRHLYGSPLVSGYGTLDDIYDLAHLPANLARYPRWLLTAQTPIILLSLASPFFLRRHLADASAVRRARAIAGMWLCCIGAVFGAYLFYQPFDDWVYIRFLLPANPPLLVLSVVALFGLVSAWSRVPSGSRAVVGLGAVVAVASYTLNYTIDRGLLNFWKADQRYVATGEYISDHLPERAVLISMQHSGTARYYSGRTTVRYDVMPPTRLEWVVEELRRLGYYPYFLLDDWEEPRFRERFQRRTALGRLDWPPVAIISGRVKIYDPADRDAASPNRAGVPEVVSDLRRTRVPRTF